jgi:predicted outer membrane repeat protein
MNGQRAGRLEMYAVPFPPSMLNGNSATHGDGGGILLYGVLTIKGSTFSGNTATNYNGGGISVAGGTLIVFDSTFTNNSASEGGGITCLRRWMGGWECRGVGRSCNSLSPLSVDHLSSSC